MITGVSLLARTRLCRLVLVADLAAMAGCGYSAAAAAPSLPRVTPVVLPRDHGAHAGFQSEWWYTVGTVADAAGHQ